MLCVEKTTWDYRDDTSVSRSAGNVETISPYLQYVAWVAGQWISSWYSDRQLLGQFCRHLHDWLVCMGIWFSFRPPLEKLCRSAVCQSEQNYFVYKRSREIFLYWLGEKESDMFIFNICWCWYCDGYIAKPSCFLLTGNRSITTSIPHHNNHHNTQAALHMGDLGCVNVM